MRIVGATAQPWLPPPNVPLSPYTGWDRSHWVALADHLLASVLPYATPGLAQYRLPGRPGMAGAACDGLEGFARTFLIAAFRIAGAGGEVPPALIERYAEGLANGTDPGHEYAWPPLTDCSQQLVEAASIALAVHETRPWLFDRLEPAVRERVLAWLAGSAGRRTWQSNWVLFPVVIQQFLANAGGPHEPDAIAAGLDRIEEWSTADGWYTDGPGRCFDYYAGWAIHLYSLMWTRMSGDHERAARYRDRLRSFLEQYQHLFGRDGAPVHQGRSLCYRYATVAPLWLGELTGASPLPPGRSRRIASGVLRHFTEHGVPDRRGLLGLGWYEPFLPATQHYSGPASPYWAGKAFLGLLLPADHPAWTAREAPAPIDVADQVVPMPGPGWLLHATRHDGLVRLLNHGSDRARHLSADGIEDPDYLRFAYTSATAPETGEPAHLHAVDGHLAVLAPNRPGPSVAAGIGSDTTSRGPGLPALPQKLGDDSDTAAERPKFSVLSGGSGIGGGIGGAMSRRRRIEAIAVFDRFAASAYEDELPAGAVRVETASVVRGAWEVRMHRVVAPAGCVVRDGGYAIAGGQPPEIRAGRDWAWVRRPDGLCSAVLAVHGFRWAGAVRGVDANAFGACSATPYVISDGHPGGSAVYVSLIVLSSDRVTPDALRASMRVEVDGDRIGVRFVDGERIEVTLGARPGYVRRPADGGPAVRLTPPGERPIMFQ